MRKVENAASRAFLRGFGAASVQLPPAIASRRLFLRLALDARDSAGNDGSQGGSAMEESSYARPTWDEYFMEVANAIAKRATCDRGRSGCVIAKDNQILATGYVGAPSGLPHCDEVGHQMKKLIHEDGTVTQHCVRTVHAEQNAICQAARRGVAIQGSTLYCRMTPCRTCAMMIINCGIVRVVAERRYHDGAESEEMFRTAGVALEYVFDEVQKYRDQ
jgi:dCMP deaminase